MLEAGRIRTISGNIWGKTMIEIRHLSKQFGRVFAVSDISLTIRDHQIFGLLGTNGAGKSTTLRMIADVLKPDSGSIHMDGQDIYDNPETKRDIFFVSDDAYFLPGYRPMDMAEYYAGIYAGFDLDRFQKLLNQFLNYQDRDIQTYSKGMRKQLSIMLGLCAGTRYLLLDETFDGLDPIMRQSVSVLLRNAVKEQGLTIIITSHNPQELDQLCDSIGFLHEGGLLLSEDAPRRIQALTKVQVVYQTQEDQISTERRLKILKATSQGQLMVYILEGDEEDICREIEHAKPVYYEFLPLSTGEMLISEMEVAGYDIRKYIQG